MTSRLFWAPDFVHAPLRGTAADAGRVPRSMPPRLDVRAPLHLAAGGVSVRLRTLGGGTIGKINRGPARDGKQALNQPWYTSTCWVRAPTAHPGLNSPYDMVPGLPRAIPTPGAVRSAGNPQQTNKTNNRRTGLEVL